MKKIRYFLLTFIILSFLTLNAHALSIDQITPSSEFLVYSAKPQEVADVLNTDLDAENLQAVENGMPNLLKHLSNI